MLLRGDIETNPEQQIRGAVKTDGPFGFAVYGRRGHHPRRTQRYQQLRSQAATLANTWQNDLSTTQQGQWVAWATSHPVEKDNGDIVILNGFQAFCRLNRTLLSIGQPMRLSMPPGTALPSITQPDATPLIPGVIAVQFENSDSWTNDTDAFAIVYIDRPGTPATRARPRAMRRLGFAQGSNPLGLPLPILMMDPWGDVTRTIVNIRARVIIT